MLIDTCSVCSKVVRNNQHGILCDCCYHWVHAKCMLIPNKEYRNLSNNVDAWFCTPCIKELFAFNNIDDENMFHSAINGNDSTLTCANNMRFEPITVSENRFLINNEDLDPENNLYTNTDIMLPDSSYTTTLELSNIMKSSNPQTLSILHVNCRSLNNSLNNLVVLLDQLRSVIPFIAVSETWTTQLNEQDFKISGYNFVAKSREHKLCGGVVIYISENIAFKVRNDLQFSTDNLCECIFIELLSDSTLIGCVYKPPDIDVNSFTADFDNMLSLITHRKQKCYIAGDFNIDLLKFERHTPTSNFVNCIFSHSFFPVINRPTRITSNTATLIDNIFTNVINTHAIKPSILYCDISDHLPIFVQVTQLISSKPRKYVYRREHNEQNKTKFILSLQATEWDVDVNTGNVDDLYTVFITKFTTCYENSFPLKKVNTSRNGLPRKPWLTTGLAKSCRKKRKAI